MKKPSKTIVTNGTEYSTAKRTNAKGRKNPAANSVKSGDFALGKSINKPKGVIGAGPNYVTAKRQMRQN